jgi:hypothetical protein
VAGSTHHHLPREVEGAGDQEVGKLVLLGTGHRPEPPQTVHDQGASSPSLAVEMTRLRPESRSWMWRMTRSPAASSIRAEGLVSLVAELRQQGERKAA